MSVRTVVSGGKQWVKNTGNEGVWNVLTLDFDDSQFSVVLDKRFDGAIGDGGTSPGGEERDMSQSVATAGQTLGEGERQC